MNNTLVVPLKDQKEKANFLLEIASIEKQLWALIHSKGLLHSDVRDLYHKVCLSYESFILNDHELTEVQDVEYSLWKLHYKHIDEFRKRIKRSSANSEGTTSAMPPSGSDDKHIEGFKSFLVKATEFYKKLIVKVRRHYGLPEESSLFKRGGNIASVEPTKLQKCHFLCHRFLVCLGDLARYMEQFEKSSVQKHNWSVAATYYLEAAIIWPDSGNPQNQNRSCHLHSLSSEVHFDFLKPSERSDAWVKSQSSRNISHGCPLKGELDHSAETNFWPLLIRTLSFFFLESSLEDFPCAFASTMRVLDMMMALDDKKLRAILESYQPMDSARTGPFRALQAVSIFIFVFHNLINSPEMEGLKDGKNKQHLELIQFALTATFIFMGRFVYRCLKANPLDSCPLLPTVLVFVEWLVSILDVVEAYGVDEKTKSSISYFFTAFIDLLKQFNIGVEVLSHVRAALWEDYELRGFAPLAQILVSLDFSTNWDQIDSYESGTECRLKRIINAALKIANRSNGSRKWITYDSLGRKFYAEDANLMPERRESEKVESTNSDVNVKGLHRHIYEATKECETRIASENLSTIAVDEKSVAMEEEEVILFKPLTRYNSAPLYGIISNAKDPASPNEKEETVPSDECLRRATSLLIAQNQAHGDTSDFHSDISNFKLSKAFKQQEPFVKEATAFSFSEVPISAGPPSLSAWVLDRGSLSITEKGRSDVHRRGLSPIEEIATSSMNDLSIHETEDSATSSRSEVSTNHYSPTPYSAPAPSAPFLPEDAAAWFHGTQSSFSEVKGSGYSNKPENFYDASRISGYPNWSPYGQLNYGSAIPGFMDKYPPFSGMTSSEWLRKYRESCNLDQGNGHALPINYYAPGNSRNFPTPDASRYGLFDQYGVPPVSNPTMFTESSILPSGFPLVYGMEEPRREKLFPGYQRPSPYGCGAMTELRDEPQPLLQYLKEKEWLLQQDPTLRSPTYMGN
ncbi:protein SMG7L-like isoform X2 [Durio zibethinus]|uniref:Protein SMG7L-like isoform X2 n=1 Tax=Durio zibethinus TaxID=66656 RepID=A0A6P5WIT2_DURZI|nr:protein SMG7L-like isoform X2 [Durio zibethinus]